MSGQFTISKVWGERFHRRSSKLESPTKDWIFYISRPTLEAARKPDREGTTVNLLRTIVEQFIEKNPFSEQYENDFKVETQRHNRDWYATICYPFDISDEIDQKKGVLIHIAEAESTDDKVSISKSKFSGHIGYPKMFDPDHKEIIEKALGGIKDANTHPNPPGVSNSDPMWIEFSSSKILPTDALLKKEFTVGAFRSIISHQYIEVRLIRSRILGGNAQHYNREQLDAISAYESLNSGFSNFAGPPGTGKSTILHMVCAHHIFQNFIKGELADKQKRIMYYVPSPMLKEEAKREIKSILLNIYEPVIKAFNDKVDTALLTGLDYIEFVSQEDLFIITSHTKLDPKYNILRETSNATIDEFFRFKGTISSVKKKRNVVKKGLRNIYFGLLGGMEVRNYSELASNKKGIDLYQPVNPDNKIGRSSVNHSLGLAKFIANKKNGDEEQQKILANLRADTEKLRSANKLYNGADDQFWDPAAVVQQSSKVNHSPRSIWGKLENSIDYIVIDEVQDISLTEIRILLQHFASRKKGEELRPFRLVCAGDENQNVNHLLFTEQNQHVRFLYNDWVLHLRNDIGKSIEGYKLSHDLGVSSDKNLVSGYRVFNEMIPYVNDVLDALRDLHTERDEKLSKSELKLTPFGRKGVCVTLGNNAKKDDMQYVDDWLDSMLDQLKKQLGLGEDNQLTLEGSEQIIVAFTFDKDDYNDNFEHDNQPNPFHDRLKKNETEYINDFAKKLDNLFTIYTDAFRKNERDLGELRDSLLLKGVMDVSSIKGLTMPMTMVLPSESLVMGEGKESEEDLSLYLVQITRAQYVNVILQDTRKFPKYPPILNFTLIDGEKIDGIPRDDVSSWLKDILDNSAGFDYSFNSLLERTLDEYTSTTLWDRLKEESESLEPVLKLYVKWLEHLFARLVEPGGTKFTAREFTNEFFTEDGKSITVDNRESANIDEINELSESYLLGEYLNHLSALKLFLTVNTWMRSKYHTQVHGNDMKRDFESWITEMNKLPPSERDYDDIMTQSWLELVCFQKDEQDNNEICENLEKTFSENQWPETSLPRLRMGPWRIKEPPSGGGPRNDEDGNAYNPWMDDGSQFFSIDPDVLNAALIRGNEDLDYYVKIQLFLGMVSQKSRIFCAGMIEVLTNDNLGLRKELLDWYVQMFENRNEHQDFKQKVSNHLEEEIRNKPHLMQALTEFLQSAETISEFESMIRAFGENWNWEECVRVFDLFEQTIELTSSYVEDYNDKEGISDRIKAATKHLKELKKLQEPEEDAFWDIVSENHEVILALADLFNVDPPEGDDDESRRDWISDSKRITNTRNNSIGMENLVIHGPAYRQKGIFSSIPDFERIMQRQEEITQYEEELAALGKRERRIKELEEDEKAIGVSKQNKIANPFKRHGPIFNFFNPLFSEKDPDEVHKLWFDLLWGVEDFLNSSNAFINNNDFEHHTLKFPSLRTDRGKQIHRCVNTFANAKDENINSIFTKLQSSLLPQLDKSKTIVNHDWIDSLMIMLESLDAAYKERKKLRFGSGYYSVDGEPGNIHSRIYEKLLNMVKLRLPRILLSYAFNMKIGDEKIDIIMHSNQLAEYLRSPQARIVYAGLENRFITADEAISAWKNLDGFITVEADSERSLYENKRPFMDNIVEVARQRERKYRKDEREWTHGYAESAPERHRPTIHESIIWPNGQRPNKKLELRFVNGAAFRGLAHLSEEKDLEASSSFKDAGLLHHSAALKLNNIFSNQKNHQQLLVVMAELLKQEYTTFIHTLYQTPGTYGMDINNNRANENWNHMYGIGPDDKKWKDNPKEHLKNSMRRKFQIQNDDIELRKNEVRFYRHATHMEQFEILRKMLEDVEKETDNQSNYAEAWEKQVMQNESQFKSFFNHQNPDATTKYQLKWSNEKTKHQPKPGFAPPTDKWFDDKRILNAVNEFLSPFLLSATEGKSFLLTDAMTLEEWREHIVNFTGVNGATLAWINPDQPPLPLPADTKRIDAQRAKVTAWCQEFEKTQLYQQTKKLQRVLKQLVEALSEEDYQDAIEGIEVEDKFPSDDRKALLSLLHELYELARPEEYKSKFM